MGPQDRPLQNRCDPFGELHAVGARGTMMGNRGGRIHDPVAKQLKRRRWASKAWICCVTEFRDYRHDVWGETYTALFFLDEVTALAAGHRPCFECRHADAKCFARLWGQAIGRDARMMAGEMDALLHPERAASGDGQTEELTPKAIAALPSGTMVSIGGEPFALRGGDLLPWTFDGYGRPQPVAGRSGQLITPPSIVRVLENGYEPRWHKSVP